MSRADYDLIVIGGGSAGLTATAGAAMFGARVALVDAADDLGGDCLHTGCVPSKTLLKCAKVAHRVRSAPDYGLPAVVPPDDDDGDGWKADLGAVMDRVRSAIGHILEHHDNPDRFRELGADVFLGRRPRFVDAHTLELGGERLRGRHFLISTGSRPAVPPVEGIEETGYWTNETVFEQTELPKRLIVVGAGPVGCEMAQAFGRLGSRVTLVETLHCVLHRDDHELACALRDLLIREGIDVRINSRVVEFGTEGGTTTCVLDTEEDAFHGSEVDNLPSPGRTRVVADAVLVATGRRPNVDGLGLEEIGVRVEGSGVVVDDKLRTSVPHVFAAGDVIGGHLFTHVAEAEAKVVVGNVLFPGSRSMSYDVVPWTTFTDPELAHVGPTEEEARQRHGDELRVYRFPFADLDRAVCEGETSGLVKVLATPKAEVVGAHILGPSAGELVHEFVLAMRHGLKLPDLSDSIHVYPTLAQADRRAADLHLRERYLSDDAGLPGRLLQWWASRHARSDAASPRRG